jgi:hypothetical protein
MICRVDYHLDNFKKHFPKKQSSQRTFFMTSILKWKTFLPIDRICPVAEFIDPDWGDKANVVVPTRQAT